MPSTACQKQKNASEAWRTKTEVCGTPIPGVCGCQINGLRDAECVRVAGKELRERRSCALDAGEVAEGYLTQC